MPPALRKLLVLKDQQLTEGPNRTLQHLIIASVMLMGTGTALHYHLRIQPEFALLLNHDTPDIVIAIYEIIYIRIVQLIWELPEKIISTDGERLKCPTLP